MTMPYLGGERAKCNFHCHLQLKVRTVNFCPGSVIYGSECHRGGHEFSIPIIHQFSSDSLNFFRTREINRIFPSANDMRNTFHVEFQPWEKGNGHFLMQ